MKENSYQMICFDSIDSTNAEAKRRILSGHYATSLYVAKTQTSGKGRLGRSFFSASDKGIYMTLAYYTDTALQDAVSITCAASVAVRNALLFHTGKSCDIKWVNDLYYKGKKVCGILCEAMPASDQTGHFIIVGIGINLSTEDFPAELSEIAGSLGTDCDKSLLIRDIANSLLHYAKNPDDRSYMHNYREYSMVLEKKVRATRGEEVMFGTVTEITDNGALVLVTDKGKKVRLDSGEVSLRVI